MPQGPYLAQGHQLARGGVLTAVQIHLLLALVGGRHRRGSEHAVPLGREVP
ncbi:hypothetical protein ACFCVY_10655 [Streptomyces sp. NPDC056411]|uniref:hypothetical protein n=1 Tax=Streptomyces sp. NPDC056411 TaxID=3345813 RepID=UPI0035DF96A6